ncbi:hypothetical protein DQK91_23405 [Oceanidesulfovibrio marinus]|uniref:Uncharacterized protein n=1 Tax=Oceanidesulfovibrio marinus TaxID=370038 RepID=A0A6P1Z8L5_9BACT|nr:hypothetical protein DQK91_23405 [Oceanidesulfovibrio marinus]
MANLAALRLCGVNKDLILDSNIDELGLELPPFFPSGRDITLSIKSPGVVMLQMEMESSPM